jgi:hypothetical protein
LRVRSDHKLHVLRGAGRTCRYPDRGKPDPAPCRSLVVAARAGAARAGQCLTANAPGRINYLESIRGLAALQA